jgi:hypothetical protein
MAEYAQAPKSKEPQSRQAGTVAQRKTLQFEDNRSTRLIQQRPFEVTQLAKTSKTSKAPKALGYKSFGGKKRKDGVKGMKSKQDSLGRGRALHVRHIIPHSDLQNWMLSARLNGNAASVAGLMRRQIYQLLVFFGEGAQAANWQNAYLAYEAGPLNQSFLQADNAIVAHIWGLIEWHEGNIFLGHAGINSAIQNRFDAGTGAIAYRGAVYINGLHAIWFAANALLGLAPTAIQNTRIYSTFLQDYIFVRTAEHNGSRPLVAATGWVGRSDYIG